MLITESKIFEHVNKRCGCQPKEDLLPSRSVPKGPPLVSQLENPTVAQTLRILASLVLEFKKLQGVPLAEEDNTNHSKTET